jgi:UDP-glucose 4-epimerase
LITGGAGFIGSHLVDAILSRSLGDVLVLDNFRRGRREYLAQHAGDPRLEIIEGDIRDTSTVSDACLDIDVVVHLAACSNVMGSEADSVVACETNVLGTLNVLDSALRAGVSRVVFSSSREVYGDQTVLPVCETASPAPKNLYGASKAAGEAYCAVFNQRGLDVRILRLTNVFGPRDTERVIPLWLERAFAGEPLHVYGGQQVLDLLWIEYTVDALLNGATVSSLPGPINVGSGQGVPILTLAERILAETGSPSLIEILKAREQEVLGYVADVRSMELYLGITPPGDPLACLASMSVPAAAMGRAV